MTRVLALMGPTASGKTGVAHEISRLIPSEAILCDSMQVYKSIPVLTQAPDDGTHLSQTIGLSEEYSAARYREDATRLIREIAAKKKLPLVVGGTGLYLRALIEGLFESAEAPATDEAFREKLRKQAEKKGAVSLHEELERLDPEAAAKIHANDTRRVIRALEVCKLTGERFSEQKKKRKGLKSEFDFRIFVLDRDRQDLYARINARVDLMLKDGLVDEVKKLDGKKISKTAQGALGIKEIRSFLIGESTLELAAEKLKKNTRNYAKRQLSWFRHEKNALMVPVGADETAKQTAVKILKLFQS